MSHIVTRIIALLAFFTAFSVYGRDLFGTPQPYTIFQNILLPHDANNVNTVCKMAKG